MSLKKSPVFLRNKLHNFTSGKLADKIAKVLSPAYPLRVVTPSVVVGFNHGTRMTLLIQISTDFIFSRPNAVNLSASFFKKMECNRFSYWAIHVRRDNLKLSRSW
jgi:hypothetical protein